MDYNRIITHQMAGCSDVTHARHDPMIHIAKVLRGGYFGIYKYVHFA